jgi:hypothetical protein
MKIVGRSQLDAGECARRITAKSRLDVPKEMRGWSCFNEWTMLAAALYERQRIVTFVSCLQSST